MPSILEQPIYQDVRYYLGDTEAVPWDVKNLRHSTAETMQRLGTPVLVKHRYNIEDVENGIAQESPTFDDVYGQSTYAQDQLSYGVGYVSVETQMGEWYDPTNGILHLGVPKPNNTFVVAPRYRGYGNGYLTYAILPDRPEDVWKLTDQGAMIRQQTARAQLPWWPQVGDNDLLITCALNPNGTIAQTFERYALKMVTPITLRGLDQMGAREPGIMANASGNRFWVGQECELTKFPTNDNVYNVETDR